MKEKPILFSGEMVRAVLKGTKTQTRRIVKNAGLYAIDSNAHGMAVAARELARLASQCPYGQPGDRLWVKETFAPLEDGFLYRADWDVEQPKVPLTGCWKPSIFCSRMASRITLEIVSVHVEYLQDISASDCRAEGHPTRQGYDQEVNDDAARDWYMDLWIGLNGLDSWEANPWVWVIEFRRVEGGAE